MTVTVRKAPHNVVVVGGGFGGVSTLKGLLPLAAAGKITLTLVSTSKTFLYTPLLHEAAAGRIRFESVAPTLAELFPVHVHIEYDTVTAISGEHSTFATALHPQPRKFDYLVVAAGSGTNFWNTAGAQEHAMQFKTLEHAQALNTKIKEGARSAIIVGAGPAGIECAVEVMSALKRGGVQKPVVTILEAAPIILSMYSEKVRAYAHAQLKKQGITVRTTTPVQEMRHEHCLLKNGERIEADAIIWTAGVKARIIESNNCLLCDPTGRYVVEPTLQSKGNPHIFVIGDQAVGAPQLAQVAMQHGAVAAYNIGALIRKAKLRTFAFASKGTLVSLGEGSSAGDVFGFAITGRLGWLLWHVVYLMKAVSWRSRMRILKDWVLR